MNWPIREKFEVLPSGGLRCKDCNTYFSALKAGIDANDHNCKLARELSKKQIIPESYPKHTRVVPSQKELQVYEM